MPVNIPTSEELEVLISRITKRTMMDILPDIIKKATRKEWLTTDDVMEVLQCSRRHIQHLRDSNQLTYSQSGRTIRYHIDDIDSFLMSKRVEKREG